MKIAFVGASGYGNVGDDAYTLVFTQQLPDCELLFFNSDLPASLPDDIGMIIIGGGGVLHNNMAEPEDAESPHFGYMKFYMDAAITRGIPWGFISCGFQFRDIQESTQVEALKPWVPYLRQARFITLRSPACAGIARELSGRDDAVCFPDAAYLYNPVNPPAAGEQQAVTLIPAGLVNPKNALINHYHRLFDSIRQPVAWLSMGAQVDDGWMLEEAAQRFPNARIIANPGPLEAFRQIAASRLVITGRYHGMVFARTSGVTFLTPINTPHKIRSEDLSLDPSTAIGHIETLRRFMPA